MLFRSGWERHTIPGVAQIINAYDIDRDGKAELIGIKPKTTGKDFYGALCSELVWLKPIDPDKDLWEEHSIGTGDGDWPHGNVIGAFLPGGGIGLVCGYHEHLHNPPQIFEVPIDPREHPWPKRVIAVRETIGHRFSFMRGSTMDVITVAGVEQGFNRGGTVTEEKAFL